MNEKPDSDRSLSRILVVALIAIAIVTAFFVGRAVTQPAPVPVAIDEPLELRNETAAGAAYAQPAAPPVRAARGENEAEPGAVAAAADAGPAVGGPDPFEPGAEAEPPEPALSAPSGEPEVVTVEPPPVAAE
jgi:hypothetical protein